MQTHALALKANVNPVCSKHVLTSGWKLACLLCRESEKPQRFKTAALLSSVTKENDSTDQPDNVLVFSFFFCLQL